MKKVEIKKSALKDFKKIDSSYKERIKEAISNLQYFPDISQIKKLTNYTPKYRLRVGNYRILFDVKDNKIIVARILHRKESYR